MKTLINQNNMMRNFRTFLLLFLISFCTIQAQENNNVLMRGCPSTIQAQEMRIQQDPEYEKFITKRKQEVNAILAQKNPSCTDGPILIPVAVHFEPGIVEAGQEACMLQVVQEQINRLNEDFGATNADIANYANFAGCLPPEALGASCIEFCLGTENHPTGWNLMDGNPAVTFGDTRWNFTDFYANLLTNTTGVPDELMSADWSGYMNIFVGDNNNFPFPLTGGILGLSEGLPGDFSGTGVYINACNFGSVPDGGTACGASLSAGNCGGGNAQITQFDGGRTLVHEIGHYLGLFHIWGDELVCSLGFPVDGPCDGSDNIADTPDMECSYQPTTVGGGCPGTDCNDSPATCDGVPDMWFNFMAYAGDACAWMFSSGQADVMYANALAAGFSTDQPAACRVSACEITAITAGMPTCSADNLTYSVDITYTDGPDASVSVSYVGGGTLGGDDPAVTANGTITLTNIPLSEDPAALVFTDTDGDCAFDTLLVTAPMCGVCEITDIVAGAPVCSMDGTTYDVDLTYTGGPDVSISVTTDLGTVAGDDPAVIADGTISITGVTSGSDVTVTITDAESLCAFGPFVITAPDCTIPTCLAVAPTMALNGTDCGDGTTGGPYTVVDNADGSSNAGEITEYIVTDAAGNITGVSSNLATVQSGIDTIAVGETVCVQAITHVQTELDAVVGEINTTLAGLGFPAVFPPTGNTLEGIYSLVAGFAPAGTVITVATIETLVANGMGGEVDLGAVLGVPLPILVDVPPFCYDISTAECATVMMCAVSSCDLMNIVPDSVTCSVDNLTYSADLIYTGGPDASVTVTTDAGTVGGDDPAVTANGTITISNIPAGTNANITITDADNDCTFGPFAITAPNCTGACAAIAPTIAINGTDCGDGTFGSPYTVVDNADGSSNAGEITEYIILDGPSGDILGVSSNLANAQLAVDTVGIGNEVCIQAITHVQAELNTIVGELDGCAFGILIAFLGPPPYTLEAIFNGVGGLGVALTVGDVETLLANGAGGNVDIGALLGFPGLTCDISPFCYNISAETCITDAPCGAGVCDVIAGEPMMPTAIVCDGEQGIVDLSGIFMGESTGTQNPADVSTNYLAVDPTTGEILSITSSMDLDLSMLVVGETACVSQIIYTQQTVNDLVDQLNSFCIPNPILPIPPELCLCADIIPLLGLPITCPTSPADLSDLLDLVLGLSPTPLTIMQLEDFLANGIDINDFDPTGVLPDIPAFSGGVVCADFSNNTYCVTVEDCCPLATNITTPAEACASDTVQVCVAFDDTVDVSITLTVDGLTQDGSAGGTEICINAPVSDNTTCAALPYDFTITADCNGTAIDLSAIAVLSTQVYPTDLTAFLIPVDGVCGTSVTVDASCIGNVTVDAPQTAGPGESGVHTYVVTWTGGGSCIVTPDTLTANYDCPCQGSISGIVTGDLTCDGPAGEPLPGMTIELQDGICTPGLDCPTTLSDLNGAYSFTNIDCGTYDVAVDETGLPCPQMILGDNPRIGLTVTNNEDYPVENFDFSTCVTPTPVGNVDVSRTCFGNALYVVDPVIGGDTPIAGIDDNWTFIWSLDGNVEATIVGNAYFSPSQTGNYTVEVIDFVNCESWTSISCTACPSDVSEIIDCQDCGE